MTTISADTMMKNKHIDETDAAFFILISNREPSRLVLLGYWSYGFGHLVWRHFGDNLGMFWTNFYWKDVCTIERFI